MGLPGQLRGPGGPPGQVSVRHLRTPRPSDKHFIRIGAQRIPVTHMLFHSLGVRYSVLGGRGLPNANRPFARVRAATVSASFALRLSLAGRNAGSTNIMLAGLVIPRVFEHGLPRRISITFFFPFPRRLSIN